MGDVPLETVTAPPDAAPRGTEAPGAEPAGLRERKKDATRRALAERALALALTSGYSGFTIAELVEDVGVSRRTFSNYFASKAEAVAAVTDGWLDDVLDAIRDAPARASLVDILQRALTAVAQEGVERWGALQALADTEPELQAQMLASDEAIADLAAREVALRVGCDVDDIRVRLIARFAVTAGREVLCQWAALGADATDARLADLLTAAFSILNPRALDSRPASARPPAAAGRH